MLFLLRLVPAPKRGWRAYESQTYGQEFKTWPFQ